MELEFRDSFLKDVNHIKEAAVKKKIATVITEAKSASSLPAIRNVKKMEGSDNYYRVRIGDYRIGVKLQGKTLIFLRCLHRKDIYRYFP
ncbi:MAG: type II toxin-antitoxin system RelE/ParE family toxin [Chloroflexota bacterium]